MPIYRYRCGSCGGHEEHLQKVSDPAVERCAKCGGPLAKQMTAAAFHLKGGGWYKDLYSSAGKSSEASPAAASSDSGASTAGSGEGAASSTPAPSTSTPSTPAPSTPSSTPTPSGNTSSAA